MVTQRRRDVNDGYGWQCRTCKKRLGSRSKSFFDKSRLTLQQWLILLYWWAREYPVTDAQEEARVSKKMAIDAYQWLREICSQKLTQTTIKLGGDGKIVHIDESLFNTNPKYVKQWHLFIKNGGQEFPSTPNACAGKLKFMHFVVIGYACLESSSEHGYID